MRLSVAVLVGVTAFFVAAEAQACRYLEMELMQLQAGGIKPSEQARARLLMNRLIKDGCRRGTPTVEAAPQRSSRSAAPSRRTATQSRRAARSATQSRSSAGSVARRSTPSEDRAARAEVSSRTANFMRAREGRYRTMCVRSCDGYYFPISFATGRENFARDAAICSQRCPSARAELYYHVAISETAIDMRGLDGRKYADEPNAFLYRASYDKSCTCGTPVGAPDLLAQVATPAGPPAPPFPNGRPALGIDPETYANRLGSFEPSKAVTVLPATAAADEIRVVGTVDTTLKLLTPIP